MNKNWWQRLSQDVEARRAAGLYRHVRSMESRKVPEILVEGKTCLNFSSNDYLGLSQHPQVIQATSDAVKKQGVGSGASHLITGHHPEHETLEQAIAAFLHRDKAILFSTGYMANLGVLGALSDKHTVMFQDKLNHASLIDAGLQNGVQLKRYQHNQVSALEQRLEQSCSIEKKIIVTDGVFSMDGDIAPLADIAELAAQYQALLYVDDAHGIGVLGEQGGGCVESLGLSQQQVPLLMGTLGKALGVFGAFVAGPESLIDYISQFARPYIYTTAMPPALATASRASLKVLQQNRELLQKLAGNIQLFKTLCDQYQIKRLESDTAIQPIILGDNRKAVEAQEKLLRMGYMVVAIRPPTVPVGTARLRITLSAAHETDHIERFVSRLAQVVHELRDE